MQLFGILIVIYNEYIQKTDIEMKIALILSTVRENRDGNRIALFAKRMLEQRGHDTTIIDPAEYHLPMLGKMFLEMVEPEEKFVALHTILDAADGFIMITAEYNHSVPPALKNLLDHFRKEYFHKPTGIISYSAGPFGGIRAAEHLRQICAELKTIAIPRSLPISRSHESIHEDGTSVNGDYERRSIPFFDEFEWYAEALKNQRNVKGLPK